MKVTIEVPDWVLEDPTCEDDTRRNAYWCYGAVIVAAEDAHEVNDELAALLASERAKQATVAANIADNDRRRHEGNKLVNPAFRYQAALREYGLAD